MKNQLLIPNAKFPDVIVSIVSIMRTHPRHHLCRAGERVLAGQAKAPADTDSYEDLACRLMTLFTDPIDGGDMSAINFIVRRALNQCCGLPSLHYEVENPGKPSDEDVREMRRREFHLNASYRELAEAFGVSQNYAGRVVTWDARQDVWW